MLRVGLTLSNAVVMNDLSLINASILLCQVQAAPTHIVIFGYGQKIHEVYIYKRVQRSEDEVTADTTFAKCRVAAAYIIKLLSVCLICH